MRILFLLAVRLFRKLCRVISYKFQRIHHISLLRKHLASFDSQSLVFNGKCILQINKGAKVTIGHNFVIWGGERRCVDNNCYSQIFVDNYAVLSIGNNSGISNTLINCEGNILIGDYVKIGAGCKICDRSPNGNNLNKEQRLIIDNHVFIGMRSVINGPVHIGEKSIIAAGSVVNTDIPKGEIWGGSPAQFIKGMFYKLTC